MTAIRILMLLVIVWGCQPREHQHQKENEVSAVPVISDGVHLNYEMCGGGDTTIVLVHGWCIDGSYWNSQLRALCDSYRVVAVDLPGHGDSGKNRMDWRIEKFGEDVASVIDQLGLERVILVGHSMGGDIILEAALQRPEQVLGLIGIDNFKDAGVSPDSATREAIAGFFERLRTDYRGTVEAFTMQNLFSAQTDTLSRQRVLNSLAAADSTIAIAILESLFKYSDKQVAQLKATGKKIFLINSDVTPTTITHLQTNGIAVEVVDIAGTGHYPMIEKPQEFNRLLQQTIEKIIR